MKKPLIILITLSVLSFFIVFSILQNYLVYSSVRKMDLKKANSLSKTAIVLPKIMNFLSFNQIEILKFWVFSLEQLPNIENLKNDIQEYASQIINAETTNKELPNKIISNLEKINEEINKIDLKQLEEVQSISKDLLIVAKKFINNDQNYIVILQNSDEIRATGGFLGSFFILETKNGQISPIQIQDIYVPDGQFKGFVEAPKGLDEYLSSGKGIRLPDSNWWPNFPDSAEQILYFFKEAERKDYQGVIAINLNTIEELLEITGEIYLPDYGKSVNKNNFSQIAREDRNEFFPGSQEKVNFLNHFLKIFKLQLMKSLQENPQKFIILAKKLVTNKSLQFYSRDEEIQNILSNRQIDGGMKNKQQNLYYFLVESNVGINKTNRLVDRQVIIDVNEDLEKITINFQNNNQLPYINYQRLYTNEGSELISVTIDGQKIEKVDQKVINTKDKQKWKEIGFLVPVLAKNHGSAEISLKSQLTVNEKKKILIQKQSGLQATSYTITYQNQNKQIELVSDQLIDFD